MLMVNNAQRGEAPSVLVKKHTKTLYLNYLQNETNVFNISFFCTIFIKKIEKKTQKVYKNTLPHVH